MGSTDVDVNSFFTLLPRNRLSRAQRRRLDELEEIVGTYFGRQESVGSACYRVRAGFRWLDHGPAMGLGSGLTRSAFVKPDYFLRRFEGVNDPTEDCLVYFVPRLVGKWRENGRGNLQELREFRRCFRRPKGPPRFPSASLTCGLLLAWERDTRQRIAPGLHWVRTGTSYRMSPKGRSRHILLGDDWGESGLQFDDTNRQGGSETFVGFLLVVTEPIRRRS